MAKREKSEYLKSISKDYFQKKFCEAFEKWQKKTGLTQKDFGERIFVSANMVSRYKNGDSTPSDAVFDSIVEEFEKEIGIERDFFYPQTFEEYYQYSGKFADRLGEWYEDYCKEIGLSQSFVELLKDITDMKNDFPLYTPMVWEGSIFSPDGEYRRKNIDELYTSMDMSEEDKYQIKMADSTITLSRCDLSFMREMQDEVQRFVQYLYYKRKLEMEKEVKEINEIAHETKENEFKLVFSFPRNKIEEIDRFYELWLWDEEDEKLNGNNNEEK